MPVSRMTTAWPWPPKSAAQVRSAPMCAVLLASVGEDSLSSWMEITFGLAAKCASAAASTFAAM